MLPLRVSSSPTYLLLSFLCLLASSSAYPSFAQQAVLTDPHSAGCDPFTPTPQHPVPGKLPFIVDQELNYYEHQVNGSGEGGYYRRSSCPALNVLANRGYINRSGRNITAAELTKAFIDVFNFGIDNVRFGREKHLLGTTSADDDDTK